MLDPDQLPVMFKNKAGEAVQPELLHPPAGSRDMLVHRRTLEDIEEGVLRETDRPGHFRQNRRLVSRDNQCETRIASPEMLPE